MFTKEDSNGGTILLSFLIGGIVGAGMALLLAPYSGKKMRDKIADAAEDAIDSASGYARKLKGKIV